MKLTAKAIIAVMILMFGINLVYSQKLKKPLDERESSTSEEGILGDTFSTLKDEFERFAEELIPNLNNATLSAVAQLSGLIGVKYEGSFKTVSLKGLRPVSRKVWTDRDNKGRTAYLYRFDPRFIYILLRENASRLTFNRIVAFEITKVSWVHNDQPGTFPILEACPHDAAGTYMPQYNLFLSSVSTKNNVVTGTELPCNGYHELQVPGGNYVMVGVADPDNYKDNVGFVEFWVTYAE